MVIYKSIFIFIFLYAAMERVLSTFFDKKQKTRGKIKYRWFTYLLICSYLCCIFVAILEFMTKVSIDYTISIIGVFTTGIGILLRNASIKALGEFWSIHIETFDGQRVVTSGPYRFLRHPYSIAVIFELIGVSLFFNATHAVLIVLLLHLPLLLMRILLEEKMLLGFRKSEEHGKLA